MDQVLALSDTMWEARALSSFLENKHGEKTP
jgi:hypothetical protein